MLALFTHPACLQHLTGSGHPESPARLAGVLKALDHDRFASIDRVEPSKATPVQLAKVHDPGYVQHILNLHPQHEIMALDADTFISEHSAQAALYAAGAAIAAVDRVMHEAELARAFCAIRPPGHHAMRDKAMGFCLFNNIAIAAQHALDTYQLERIAIVDFDVHHGNGTQQAFAQDARVMYLSTHQAPFYPFSGKEDEIGCGNIYNRCLAADSDAKTFRAAWADSLLPRLDHFAPQLILISAGFDAHKHDPQADIHLDIDDFAWLTRQLVNYAVIHAEGRMVSCLEGGYDTQALAACVCAHISELSQP